VLGAVCGTFIYAVCGRASGFVRKCSSVRGSERQCAAVCDSVRQCAAVCAALCGSATSDSVRQGVVCGSV
jgi:hypothetical protein